MIVLLPDDEQAVVLNEETAADNHIQLGETITLELGELGDDKWQVVGFYRMLVLYPMPDAIYAPQAAIFGATTKHNVGRRLLVRTNPDDAATTEAVTLHLKDMFEKRNWEVQDTQSIYEDHSFFDNFFVQYLGMLFGLTVIMAVVECTKEIGVKRAIGARTPFLMLMFILEGVLQGLTSRAVPVPLSFVLGRPLASVVGYAMFDVALDYQYNLQAVFVWLVTMVVISILASVMPARSATTISVRESLAYA